VSPPEGGVVTSSPHKESYTANDVVTVTAMAESGYTFTGWTGAASDRTDHATVIMDGDKTVTANFYKQSVSTPTYQPTTPIPAPTYQQPGVVGGGTLTDSRDGKTYKTVVIGEKRWMAENLNYKTTKSYSGTYGRLYTWNAAMSACPRGWHLSTRQDWDHLAQAVGGKEVRTKVGDVDFIKWDSAGTKLRSSIGWTKVKFNQMIVKTPINFDLIQGTDDYGFSALPNGLGIHNLFISAYNGTGFLGAWWTDADLKSKYAYSRSVSSGVYEMNENILLKKFELAVRCVCDDPPQVREEQTYASTQYVRQDEPQPNVKRSHWYATSKYHFPISETSSANGGFGGEIGRISKNGWFFGVDIGSGHDKEEMSNSDHYLERGNVGAALDFGGVYNLTENLQLLYGVALGYWAFERVESGMYMLWGNDDPEIGYLEQGFIGPSIKLRWRFIELSYRGLVGNGWTKHVRSDGDKYDCYNSQLMLGINSYGLVKLISEGW